MGQFWTNRSQVFRSAAALAGVPACLLLMLFGAAQLAGIGAFLAPALGVLSAAWLLLASLALLSSLLAEISENRQQLLFAQPPVQLRVAACRLFSFIPFPASPPPRLFF